MNKELSDFAARLRETISFLVTAEVARLQPKWSGNSGCRSRKFEPPHVGCYERNFDSLALELFTLQFQSNPAYQKFCRARGATPQNVGHWTQIPAVPTGAFKELELTCLAPNERIAVFHSSGTSERRPSRHFHCAESLGLYEASLWPWFQQHIVPEFGVRSSEFRISVLAPPPAQAPHSSLVHMFETVRQKIGGASGPASHCEFLGRVDRDGAWALNFDVALAALNSSLATCCPLLLLGTAFSFVHLLDFLSEQNGRFDLPAGSRVMETGGYKNQSRSMPKAELHTLITERLGVPAENIICEYGMSELSSQAYDSEIHPPSSALHSRVFRFPPWAQVQIISPETGHEVADGKIGLIRVYDLANVFSVAAIQTEDLGIRRPEGFELIGRAQWAKPRGCSLMTA